MSAIMGTLNKNRTRVITLAILILLFLTAIRGMSTKDWVITTLRGLSVGAVTFLAAAGMSLIFGLMDVLNLAHGALFMIGAYAGWSAYVRPDTFVDLLTPLALLAAGFVLLPVWRILLGRLRLSADASRIWPWLGLILGGVILIFAITRTPLAIWDPEVYNDSPIVWVQSFDNGQIKELVQPAQFDRSSPVFVFGALLLGGILLAVSSAGFSRRRLGGGAAGTTTTPVPKNAIAIFAVLVIVGVGVFLINDALTERLFDLNKNWLFLFAILVAVFTGALLGGAMETTLIRPLYARPLYQLMLTLGLGFIGTEVVRALWGRTGFTMPKPDLFAGSGDGCPATNLGDWLRHQCSILTVSFGEETARIRVYNEIFLILAGLLVLVVVWVLIQRTRMGMIIRAGVQDSEMVEALGINVRRVFTLVFALGTGLAALGGVLSGPSTGLSDGMGENLLLGTLIALAIGGLTSFPGAAAGAVLVGLLEQFIIKYGQLGISLPFLDEPFKPTPTLVPAASVLLMVIILLVMPQGLFGRKE